MPINRYFISDFVSIQRQSFLDLLENGLIEELKKINPITNRKKDLEFFLFPEYYRVTRPEYSPQEAILKNKSYTSKIFVPVQFTDRKNKQIAVKWVYIGNLPIMTKRGHFILNGGARVIVNQILRSPGIYYQQKTYENYIEKWSQKPEDSFKRYYADIICMRGTWLRIEMDKEKNIWAQMKKGPKIPIFWFLLAMGLSEKIIFKTIKESYKLIGNLEKHNSLVFPSARPFLYRKDSFRPQDITDAFKEPPNDKQYPYDPYDLYDKEHNIVEEINTMPYSKTSSSQLLDLTPENPLKKKMKNKYNYIKNPMEAWQSIYSLITTKKSKGNISRHTTEVSASVGRSETGYDSISNEHSDFKAAKVFLNLNGGEATSKKIPMKGASQPSFSRPSCAPFLPVRSKEQGQEEASLLPVLASHRKEAKQGQEEEELTSYKTSFQNQTSTTVLLCEENAPCFTHVNLVSEGLEEINNLSNNVIHKDKLYTRKTKNSHNMKELKLLNINQCKNFELFNKASLFYTSDHIILKKLGDRFKKLNVYSYNKNNVKKDYQSTQVFQTLGKLEAAYCRPSSVYNSKATQMDNKARGKESYRETFDEHNLQKKKQPSISIDNPTAMEGRKWLYNRFLNPRFYDLSKQGRYALNHKLGLNISLKQRTLTGLDILYATDYLIKVDNGVYKTDDIDHLKNRRVRTSGELIQIQIGVGLVRLEKSIRENLNKVDVSTSLRETRVFSRSCLSSEGQVSSFINKASLLPVQSKNGERETDSQDGKPPYYFKAINEGHDRKEPYLDKSIIDASFLFAKGVSSRPSFSRPSCAPFLPVRSKEQGQEKASLLPVRRKEAKQGQEEPTEQEKGMLLSFSRPCWKGAQEEATKQLRKGRISSLPPVRSNTFSEGRERASLLERRTGKGDGDEQHNLLYNKLLNLVNPKAFNSAIREFFGTSPLSQFMDQINPLAELTHKRRLSSMGPGGVTRDTATLAIRGIHPTHYGRICPIETPEGKNTGLVNSMTTYARINSNGIIESPFYKVYKGQVQKKTGLYYFSAEQEEKLKLAAADLAVSKIGFLPKALIPVRIAEEFTKISRLKVQYIGVSPLQMISVAASLIPFLEHDDANRALMGSNMQRQAVPLIRPERPIVGTGLEARTISDSGHALFAKYCGLVTYVSSNKIKILSYF